MPSPADASQSRKEVQGPAQARCGGAAGARLSSLVPAAASSWATSLLLEKSPAQGAALQQGRVLVSGNPTYEHSCRVMVR